MYIKYKKSRKDENYLVVEWIILNKLIEKDNIYNN